MKKSRWVPIGFLVLGVMWIIHFTTNHFAQFGPIRGHTAPATHGPSALVRSLRPNYPYSIIAGGAYSPQELQYADGKDAIVRAHYADFDMTHAKVVRLTDDRYQYVSYRQKDQVYWTKKKLKIPNGELLLTDGVQYARTRCGNRLSDRPQKAVSPHEPDTAMLNLPPVSLDLLPKLALADPPVTGKGPAVLPLPLQVPAIAPWPLADQPLVPLVPVWGGQPIVPGMLTPAVATSSGNPSGYVSSTPPKGPTLTTPPNSPPPTQPPPQAPVPEPGSVYLVLITLLYTGSVLLRIGRRSSADESTKPN